MSQAVTDVSADEPPEPSSRTAHLVGRALGDVQSPSIPVREAWSYGISDLLARLPHVPAAAVKVFGLLDRVGRLGLSPTHVTLDADSLAWNSLSELRVGSLLDVASEKAVDVEVNRLLGKLPPVPMKKWVAQRLSRVLLALAVVVVQRSLRADSESAVKTVPVAVVTRGRFGRTNVTHPGLFAMLICAAVPSAADAIVATAKSHGIPVVVETHSTTRNYAALAEERLNNLSKRLRKEEEE